MKKLYYFIGKHLPEIMALIGSSVVFAVGIYFAFTYNPVSLNRAGALIIIIGVLLAASRFHEWVAQNVIDSIKKNPEKFSLSMLSIHEKIIGAPLSGEKREEFLSDAKKRIKEGVTNQQWFEAHVSSLVEPHRARLKRWEIYLVIGGTFLNGFGDYIVSLLKS
jgi:hypothetical protein